MTRTIKIQGMMCGHCEKAVKNALEAIPEVASAEPNKDTGEAIVTLHAEVANDVLKKAVEAEDFTVTSIE